MNLTFPSESLCKKYHSYRFLPHFTDSYRILPILTAFYRNLPVLTVSYRFLPIFTDSGVLLRSMGEEGTAKERQRSNGTREARRRKDKFHHACVMFGSVPWIAQVGRVTKCQHFCQCRLLALLLLCGVRIRPQVASRK